MNKKNISLNRLSLIVGLLGILTVALGLGLAPRAHLQELGKNFEVAGLILLGIGIVGLIIAWRQDLLGFSRSRQARYGSMAIILSLSFIGIVVMVNYLAYRHDMRWDLTQNKSFTLAEQTQKILKNLDQKVTIKAFLRSSDATRQDAINRLEGYRTAAADGKFEFEIIDPDRQPGETLRYGVTSPNTLIVESGKSRKEIYSTEEAQISSAILSVTRKERPKIYFLTGHNELSPEDYDARKGLSNMKTGLEQENYQVATLALPAQHMKVPDDAKAVVIAGAEETLTTEERKAIEDYVDKRHGNLMLMLQPRHTTGLEGWLNTLGVQVGNDLVIDPGRNIQNDVTFPAFNEYPYHEITKDMKNKFVSLPLARTVSVQSPPKTVQATELMRTTPVSWAETNLKDNALIQKDPGDQSGPLSVAVALSINPPDAATDKGKDDKKSDKKDQDKKPKPSRVVVIGNSMFANNYFSRLLGNGDFFLNSVAWLAAEDDLIAIRSKPKENRQLQLTNQQERWVFNFSLFGMPLLMLILGVFVWWKRR